MHRIHRFYARSINYYYISRSRQLNYPAILETLSAFIVLSTRLHNNVRFKVLDILIFASNVRLPHHRTRAYSAYTPNYLHGARLPGGKRDVTMERNVVRNTFGTSREREREKERIFASFLEEECRFRGSMKTYQPFHDTHALTFIVWQTRYLIVGGGGTPRVIDSFDPGLRPDLP